MTTEIPQGADPIWQNYEDLLTCYFDVLAYDRNELFPLVVVGPLNFQVQSAWICMDTLGYRDEERGL